MRLETTGPYRLTLAVKDGGLFRFRCPFSATKLHLHRIEFRELIRCPMCKKSFEVATRRQLRQFRRQQRRIEREKTREVKEMRRRGVLPPDRISVVGVPSSGKSVYLASLYHFLWQGTDALNGQALNGKDHSHLLGDFAHLQEGNWLASTIAPRPFDVTLGFRGVDFSLTGLDFSGELFVDVFYNKQVQTQQQNTLFDQIQSTLGVMILLDPLQVAGIDGEKNHDVEFTAIEVVKNLRSRGLVDHIVIVLTKRNENRWLIDSHGGPCEFLANTAPRLRGAAPNAPVFHLSAVRTILDDNNERTPAADDSTRDEVLAPLVSLLNRIDPLYLEYLRSLDHEAVDAANSLSTRSLDSSPLPDGDTGTGTNP